MTGVLKVPFSEQGITCLRLELATNSALLGVDGVPAVLAWAPTCCGGGAVAILFERLPGTLDDDFKRRMQAARHAAPRPPGPTPWAPLYTALECHRIVQGIVRAVAAAHARGVLHLDVKPTNIMLDGLGGAKLADWGLSVRRPAAASGEAFRVRGPMGTQGYCVAELNAGRAIVPGHESMDTQPLAVSVAEMLVQEQPHVLRQWHRNGTLIYALPKSDPVLVDLIMGALSEDVARRPPLYAWLAWQPPAPFLPAPQPAHAPNAAPGTTRLIALLAWAAPSGLRPHHCTLWLHHSTLQHAATPDTHTLRRAAMHPVAWRNDRPCCRQPPRSAAARPA